MSNVPYHAWTHRPKALGGTDPIASPTCSYARAWLPSADSYELTDPTVLNPIVFTNMKTNNTAVFVESTDPGQEPDSAIQVLVPGLYIGQAKVEFVHDGMSLHQTFLLAGDVNYGFGGTGIPLDGSGSHGANLGVVTGEDPQAESTDWGYDVQSAVWLEQPDTTAQFYIEANVIDGDGGVGDPVYVNQAHMWILHLPLSSLVETDIFTAGT